MNLLRILVVFAGLLFAHGARAGEVVTERAWVEDPLGNMTLAEVQDSPETRFDGNFFSQGFSRSVYWLRLRVAPDLIPKFADDKELVVRILPAIQDQIQLFDPLDQHQSLRLTGDYYDWAKDEYQSLNLNFVIPRGEQPRDIWLRLRTHQSTMTMVDVVPISEVRSMDRRQELWSMLYFAVLIVCMGWGVLSFINQREILLGAYIFREFLAIAYALTVLGYLRAFSSGWLPTEWVDPLSNYLIFAFVGYVIWFDTLLIREFKPNPWLIRIIRLLILLTPVEIALFALGYASIAVIMNSGVVLLVIVLVLLAAISTRAWEETRAAPPDQRPVFSKAFLVGIYALVALVVLTNRAASMGFVQADKYMLYLVLVYALLSSIAMMVLVQVRTQRHAQRQLVAQHRLEYAEQAAEQERTRRVEQSNFLKMLAHEMKTPLSVVRMAVGNAKISERTSDMVDRAIADMNGVIERLLQVERLQDQQMALQMSRVDLVAIVQSILDGQPQGARIQFSRPERLVVDSDARLVQIVFSNLIDNAIKYSPTGSLVSLTLEQDSRGIRACIENDIGSAGAPDPERVFDKYYRSARAHERTGSGLGLYLVKTLARMLGGDVRYTQKSQRVCFELALPVSAT